MGRGTSLDRRDDRAPGRPGVRVIGHGQFLRIRPDDDTDAEAAAVMAALEDARVEVTDVDAFFVRDGTIALESLDAMDAAVALLERGGARVVVVTTALEGAASAVVLAAP